MRIVFYSRDNCDYCIKLKKYLETKKLEFTEFKLNVDFTREELLELFPNAKTFPVVVVDEKFIGGYSNFVEMYQKQCECDNCECGDIK